LGQARDAMNTGDIGRALDRFEDARAVQPPGSCYELWFAKNLLGSLPAAIEPAIRMNAEATLVSAAARAPACTEERSNALLLISLIHEQMGRGDRQEEALRRAIASAPFWYTPHATLAALLVKEHRWSEATAEAATAVSLSGRWHDDVRDFYARILAARPPVQ